MLMRIFVFLKLLGSIEAFAVPAGLPHCFNQKTKSVRRQSTVVLQFRDESHHIKSSADGTPVDQSDTAESEQKNLIVPITNSGVPVVFSTKDDNSRNARGLSGASDTGSLEDTNEWWSLSVLWKRWKALRPATRFRASVILATFTILSFPQLVSRSPQRLWTTVISWLSNRGFQGLAALGRSVTYGWGLLVAYPRLLDRRAKERQQRAQERQLELDRQRLSLLNSDVSRLRQELSGLDAEIRAFRREIIAIKAANKVSPDIEASDEIQQAIDTEMAHLQLLRSETIESLQVARQIYKDAVRSKGQTK